MKLPHVIKHGGAKVYAPRCCACGSDTSTRWVHLPSLREIAAKQMARAPQGYCSKCGDHFFPYSEEAWRAREPERLEARLAELRSAS